MLKHSLIGFLAVVTLCVPALASAAPETAGTTQANHDSVREICKMTLRLEPGGADYHGCVSSLMDTLETVRRSRGMQRANEACLARGLKQGSSDLALCMIEAAWLPSGPSDPAISIAEPTALIELPGGARSYFYTSNQDNFRRFQLACALMGFSPGGGEAALCVANLQSALFAIDNPAH